MDGENSPEDDGDDDDDNATGTLAVPLLGEDLTIKIVKKSAQKLIAIF